MVNIKCPLCEKKNVVKDGCQKNKNEELQRYFCKSCKKWFNEKKLNLTKEELIINELIKNLFIFKRKYARDTKKIVPGISLRKFIKFISDNIKDRIENNKTLSNEQLQFINISRFFSDNVVAKLQKKEHRIQRPRKTKEYLINTHSSNFMVVLRDKNTLFITNTFPDKQCKDLTLETPNYIINIKKRSGRYSDFEKRFEAVKKEREENLKNRI